MSLDIKELIDDALHINKKTYNVYETILSKIYSKLKLINKKKIFYMVYEVPYYIIGFPVYDMKTCLTFLIMTLRKKGMFVKYKSPNILFIHWGVMIQKNYEKMLKDNNYYIGDKFQELQKVKPQTNKNIQQINNNLVKDYKSNDEDRNIDRLIEMSKYLD
jgi:hypothetical protein